MSNIQENTTETIQDFLAKYPSPANLPKRLRNRYFVCSCGQSFLLPAFLHHKIDSQQKHSTFSETLLKSLKRSKQRASCSPKKIASENHVPKVPIETRRRKRSPDATAVQPQQVPQDSNKKARIEGCDSDCVPFAKDLAGNQQVVEATTVAGNYNGIAEEVSCGERAEENIQSIDSTEAKTQKPRFLTAPGGNRGLEAVAYVVRRWRPLSFPSTTKITVPNPWALQREKPNLAKESSLNTGPSPGTHEDDWRLVQAESEAETTAFEKRTEAINQRFDSQGTVTEVTPVIGGIGRKSKLVEPISTGRPFLEAAEEVARKRIQPSTEQEPMTRRAFLEVSEEIARQKSADNIKNSNSKGTSRSARVQQLADYEQPSPSSTGSVSRAEIEAKGSLARIADSEQDLIPPVPEDSRNSEVVETNMSAKTIQPEIHNEASPVQNDFITHEIATPSNCLVAPENDPKEDTRNPETVGISLKPDCAFTTPEDNVFANETDSSVNQRFDEELASWQVEPFPIPPSYIGDKSLEQSNIVETHLRAMEPNERVTVAQSETAFNQTIDLSESDEEAFELETSSKKDVAAAFLKRIRQPQSSWRIGKPTTASGPAGNSKAIEKLGAPWPSFNRSNVSVTQNNLENAAAAVERESAIKARGTLDKEATGTHQHAQELVVRTPLNVGKVVAFVRPSAHVKSAVRVRESPAGNTAPISNLSEVAEVAVTALRNPSLLDKEAEGKGAAVVTVASGPLSSQNDADESIMILDDLTNSGIRNTKGLEDVAKPKRKRTCYRLPKGFVHFCKICNKQFRDAYNLNLHKQARHSDLFPFHCSICSKGLSSRQELQECEEMHDEGTEFMCQECHVIFNKAAKLRKHRKLVHELDEKPIVDVTLGEAPSDGSAKQVGLQATNSEDTATKSTSTRHPEKESNQETPAVGVTIRAPTQKPKTKTTKQTQAANSCNPSLRVVLNRVEIGDGRTDNDGVEPVSWYCSNQYCGRKFHTEDALQNHKATCQKFRCVHCPKRYSHNQTLQQHILQEHREHFNAAGKEIYKCPHCNKEFIRKPDFKGHVSLHTKFRIYRCEHCDKSFRQISELSAHRNKTHKTGLAHPFK